MLSRVPLSLPPTEVRHERYPLTELLNIQLLDSDTFTIELTVTLVRNQGMHQGINISLAKGPMIESLYQLDITWNSLADEMAYDGV